MIEIEGNRLYWNGVRICYASHEIPDAVTGDCCVMYSHRYQRNLILCAGKYWLGTNNNTLPATDIVIGSVIGLDGMLSDDSLMTHITELVQAREDYGMPVRFRLA